MYLVCQLTRPNLMLVQLWLMRYLPMNLSIFAANSYDVDFSRLHTYVDCFLMYHRIKCSHWRSEVDTRMQYYLNQIMRLVCCFPTIAIRFLTFYYLNMYYFLGYLSPYAEYTMVKNGYLLEQMLYFWKQPTFQNSGPHALYCNFWSLEVWLILLMMQFSSLFSLQCS